MIDNTHRIEKMHALLTQSLAPTQLDIIDDSHKHIGHAGAASGAGHFTVKISAEAFRDQPMLKQHRMVYDALDSMMPDDIHALSIQSSVPT